LNFQLVDLNNLLQKADIVTIHLPLTKETHHIINKDNILNFKKGSYLINTARGGLVDAEAIMLGLEKGILEGVGLDVLEEEKELTEEVEILTRKYGQDIDLKTLVLDHILINHPKVVITPHNAFNSREALERILQTTINNIKGFIDNHPINIVE
jgi:D-lactate dehydrogenase